MPNTNTQKFHYLDCNSVKQMKDKNKSEAEGNRCEAGSVAERIGYLDMNNTETMNQEDKYIVYYRKNDLYSDAHLPLIIIGIIISLFVIITPELRAIGIFALLFLVTLLGLLILSMVRARGEELPLLEMDQTGIVDHNPGNDSMYVKWEDVDDISIKIETVRASKIETNTILALAMKDKNIFGCKAVGIKITYAMTEPEEILHKAKEYKRKAAVN